MVYLSISTTLDNRVSECGEGILFNELTCGRQQFLTLVNTVKLGVETRGLCAKFGLKPGPTLGTRAPAISDIPRLAVPLGGTRHHKPYSVLAVRYVQVSGR